jgi:ATP-dependent helicase HrpA
MTFQAISTNIPEQLSAEIVHAHLRLLCSNDQQILRRLWQFISRRQQENQPCDRKLAEFRQKLMRAITRVNTRNEAIPAITYDDKLPISAKREAIAELIQQHQVVILAGETGSGKTTQIPKICLELGRGVKGMIGHTQPRRIAARTVASRIADELQVPLGGAVGYQVRFTDHSDHSTYIKLMTDGILLAEIQQDPLLLKYDTLIIDEAHERSLNIDFLLGYLKELLPKRKDLKVIVTSATIDLEKFSAHFSSFGEHKAPVLEVSGRTFPVETLYRPWDEEYEDATEAIVGAVDEILQSSKQQGGDILVFLSGEREIRETSHAIKKAGFAQLDILPLYARLGLAEQNRVFQGHRGRRVVLATNVAETSLTVPGIRYVIDPGRARISRYSVRTKVQRLPIEAISQASANQRKGRCGRVSEGVCYRLYSEEDFVSRPEFTDPEIQRTSLAAVILQMLQLRIGDVRKFPFVDKPENRLINDGFKLLEEIQAVDKKGQITVLGKQLHGLPVDPRFARIIIEAGKLNCLSEILIIVSGLSIQDPRERPAEKRQAADEQHRRFRDEESDFIALTNLWRYLEELRQELSQNKWGKRCKKEFISYLRVREWRDLHHQLRLAIKALGLKENAEPSSYENVHRALVAGLLSNLGLKNEEGKGSDSPRDTKREKSKTGRSAIEYLGSRNRKFQIFPGSSQAKKKPKWLVGAEFIETTQLYAHMVAKVDPDWALECGRHQLKYHYFQPFYDALSGQVMAYARISIYGLILVEKKRVAYGKIDSVEARTIFIREALVEGKYRKHKSVYKKLEAETRELADKSLGAQGDLPATSHFFAYNQWLVEQVQSLEAKARRRDILVDDEIIFDFYAAVIPADICNLASFEQWRKKAEANAASVLKLVPEQLMLHGAEGVSENQFPDVLESDGLTLPLHYHFEPGHSDDGVSVRVPVEFLHLVPEGRLEWLVPGLLRDKCIALVKALPKQERKKLVPVPQYVDRALARLKPSKRPLAESLAEVLEHIANIRIEHWPIDTLEDFYRMNIQVVDERGDVIDRDRDLATLRERYRQQVRNTLSAAHHSLERENITRWDFNALPEEVKMPRGKIQVKAFPALVDRGTHVDLEVLDNPLDAHYSSTRGVVRLAQLALGPTIKYLRKELLRGKDLGLAVLNLGKRDQVIDDILFAAVQRACFQGEGELFELVRNQSEFERRLEAGRGEVVEIAQQIAELVAELLPLAVEIRKQMKANKNALVLAFAFGDINHQMQSLFAPGFLAATRWHWLKQYPRYLRGIIVRLEKAPQNPQKDKMHIASLETMWRKHADQFEKVGIAQYTECEPWQQYRWMIEELRISLFAQTLKTLFPVSEKRLNKQWQSVLDTL